MGQYINPAEIVEENGRPIDLKESLPETEAQLQPGERACVVARRMRKVVLVIHTVRDFTAVKAEPEVILGVYAVGHYIIEICGTQL